jgi:glycosyltransferase involved in cell wall biosynthesis
MYPRFSQTFIVNEMLELERLGLDLRILSLRLPNEGIFHESVARLRARADYLSEDMTTWRLGHWKAQWDLFRRSPRNYAKALRLVSQSRGAGRVEMEQAERLLSWARKREINHVHVHFGTEEASVALLASMMGGLSYSLTLHAFDIFRDNVDLGLLAKKINSSRFTVTVCEANRRYLVDKIPGIDASKVRVNYNGIDLSEFLPASENREKYSVFSVGRLIEKKGFVHLVRAVGLLRDEGLPVVCRIAGEGREKVALTEEIKRLGLRDHFRLLGSVRQDEVCSWMQRSACFALPCVRAADGNIDALPTVLLESLACGCPTISTRLNGIPEIIEDGVSGALVEPGCAEALADAIRSVLTDELRASALAAAGRRRAEERFDLSQNAAVMFDWLAAAVRTKPKERAVVPPAEEPCGWPIPATAVVREVA